MSNSQGVFEWLVGAEDEKKVKWTATFVLIACIAVSIRLAVGSSPFSGEAKPPMYGDYEAQRHWMEITLHTPAAEWYFNTTDNDLMYWGLDYPPLTAFHSWFLGYISNLLEPQSVALFSSKGYSSPSSRHFMRLSVLVSELFVFMSGCVAFCWTLYKTTDLISIEFRRFSFLLLMLLNPAIILIDHGHFQYNTVVLGLTLWATVAILTNWDVLGSILFTLALNFKQMSLYYAPPVFFLLLMKTLQSSKGRIILMVRGIVKLGLTVILTFALVWSPICLSGLTNGNLTKEVITERALQILHRLFPVARGIFEDKVANIWCSLSPVLRLSERMAKQSLFVLTGSVTLFALIPCIIGIIKHRNMKSKLTLFLFSQFSSSLSFFLFSYQVHEKTILIVLLPVMLLLGTYPYEMGGFSIMAVVSMLPLLWKDGLIIDYFAVTMLFILFLHAFIDKESSSNQFMKHVVYPICISVVLVFQFVVLRWWPVKRYPDLGDLNVSIVCAFYFFCWWVKIALLFVSNRANQKASRNSLVRTLYCALTFWIFENEMSLADIR